MRGARADRVTEAVRNLCIEANTRLPEEHLGAPRRALDEEESPLGREVMGSCSRTLKWRERCVAFCQDTGSAVFFVEIGGGVRLVWAEMSARP